VINCIVEHGWDMDRAIMAESNRLSKQSKTKVQVSSATAGYTMVEVLRQQHGENLTMRVKVTG
jgi:hypothetical protein